MFFKRERDFLFAHNNCMLYAHACVMFVTGKKWSGSG